MRAIPELLRQQILARDRYRCRKCGARATHIDHVVPRHLGGSDHPRNLAALCRACHQRKTSREANAARYARALRTQAPGMRALKPRASPH